MTDTTAAPTAHTGAAPETDAEPERTSRMGKRDFIHAVAQRSEIPATVVERVYESFMAVILESVRERGQLVLTGFGKFYRQRHKGHRVQFAKGSADHIPDYSVLKFSATRRSNRYLEDAADDGGAASVEDSAQDDAA